MPMKGLAKSSSLQAGGPEQAAVPGAFDAFLHGV